MELQFKECNYLIGMTKKFLTNNIKLNANIKESDALKITNSFFKLIKLNLQNKIVKVSGFGTFYKKNTVQRIGRNPMTKEEFTIPSKDKAAFKASNKLKKKIN